MERAGRAAALVSPEGLVVRPAGPGRGVTTRRPGPLAARPLRPARPSRRRARPPAPVLPRLGRGRLPGSGPGGPPGPGARVRARRRAPRRRRWGPERGGRGELSRAAAGGAAVAVAAAAPGLGAARPPLPAAAAAALSLAPARGRLLAANSSARTAAREPPPLPPPSPPPPTPLPPPLPSPTPPLPSLLRLLPSPLLPAQRPGAPGRDPARDALPARTGRGTPDPGPGLREAPHPLRAVLSACWSRLGREVRPGRGRAGKECGCFRMNLAEKGGEGPRGRLRRSRSSRHRGWRGLFLPAHCSPSPCQRPLCRPVRGGQHATAVPSTRGESAPRPDLASQRVSALATAASQAAAEVQGGR